jgi:hypothetical protein
MTVTLSPSQLDVISFLLAGARSADSNRFLCAPFFRAFDGGFAPGQAFCCYRPGVNNVRFYVRQDPRDQSSRAEKEARCEDAKHRIMEIAKFLEELFDAGLVKAVPKPFVEEPLPADLANNWKHYGKFYGPETDTLLFACNNRFEATEKLCALAESALPYERKAEAPVKRRRLMVKAA